MPFINSRASPLNSPEFSALMERLWQRKTELNGIGAVVTFSPHPLRMISGHSPELISDEHIKVSLLKDFFSVEF